LISTRRPPPNGWRDKLRSRSYAEVITIFSAILCGLGVSAMKTRMVIA